MDDWGDLFVVVLLWLSLMTLAGFWAVRIAMLVHRGRKAEKALRLYLAVARGRTERASRS